MLYVLRVQLMSSDVGATDRGGGGGGWLQVEVNQDTQEPSDTLTATARDWLVSMGSSATSVTEILEPGDQSVLQAIQNGIDLVNSQATSNAMKVQKWSLLPKDFSIPGGELGKETSGVGFFPR